MAYPRVVSNPLNPRVMSDDTGDTDDLILNLLRENDVKALSVVFDAHYRPVYNNIRKIIKNGDDAKDIVLELFQAVWEKRQSLNITKPVRRYLITAAHNRAVNYLRDRHRANTLLNSVINLSASGRTVPAADMEIEAKELNKIIKTAVALLPEKARITFLMSRNFGLTYREIAIHLNVTEKAVEKNMTKALRLLRAFLAPYLKMLLILAGC